MRFRLVATDLDGTLLSSRQQVSCRNLAVLKLLADRGVHICIATGRHPASAVEVTSCFDFPHTLIAFNGALTIDRPSGEVRSRRFLQPKETHAVLHYLDFLGLTGRRDLFTEDAWYVSPLKEEAASEARRLGLVLGEISAPPPELEAAKLMIQTPLPKSREILQQMSAHFPEMHIVLSTPTLLEVMAPGASKGASVLRLAADLGIQRDQIIAFGDQLNDVDMLAAAGYGVAMGNAVDEAKAVAAYVTLPHDQDGVAVALEEFLTAS